jgi:cell division septum initiation protein DivIVA
MAPTIDEINALLDQVIEEADKRLTENAQEERELDEVAENARNAIAELRGTSV